MTRSSTQQKNVFMEFECLFFVFGVKTVKSRLSVQTKRQKSVPRSRTDEKLHMSIFDIYGILTFWKIFMKKIISKINNHFSYRNIDYEIYHFSVQRDTLLGLLCTNFHQDWTIIAIGMRIQTISGYLPGI